MGKSQNTQESFTMCKGRDMFPYVLWILLEYITNTTYSHARFRLALWICIMKDFTNESELTAMKKPGRIKKRLWPPHVSCFSPANLCDTFFWLKWGFWENTPLELPKKIKEGKRNDPMDQWAKKFNQKFRFTVPHARGWDFVPRIPMCASSCGVVVCLHIRDKR